MKETIRPIRTLGSALALFLIILSCAQQSARGPQGGPKDITPPRVDSLKSTPNMQTRFTERKIELVFDEWIQTRNLISKILISPPLQYLPRIQSRGKKITLEFNEKEELKENATYIFNFGDAVSDFREGNKIENLSFVFSTGDVIDSLGFEGTVVDAFTGKPVQDVYVMLYDILEDSVVYKQKPFYFVNTNKEGIFTFQNIRSDSFKLFALKDGNLNYTYDPGLEQAGFTEEIIYLTDDFDSTFQIEVFTEERTPQFSKLVTFVNGIVKLLFKDELKQDPVFYTDPLIEFPLMEKVRDTFFMWYRDTSTFSLYIGEDTLVIHPSLQPSFLESPLQVARRIPTNLTLSPRDSLIISFPSPLGFAEKDSISISDTSGTARDIQLFVVDKDLKITGNWKQDSLLNVLIKPSAIQDIFGRNNDTISFTFTSAPYEKYGDILFTITDLDTGYVYIIDLLKGNETIRKSSVSGVDSTTISFRTLAPGDYSIFVLEDRNEDRRWNPGSYADKRHSERKASIKLESLRENWELQATHQWKTKSK